MTSVCHGRWLWTAIRPCSRKGAWQSSSPTCCHPDGVYQAPGGSEEDTADGISFGGWQAPVSDDEAGAAIGEEIGRIDALLLGRKTYDIFAALLAAPVRRDRRHA
jgi:hypothetical protein